MEVHTMTLLKSCRKLGDTYAEYAIFKYLNMSLLIHQMSLTLGCVTGNQRLLLLQREATAGHEQCMPLQAGGGEGGHGDRLQAAAAGA